MTNRHPTDDSVEERDQRHTESGASNDQCSSDSAGKSKRHRSEAKGQALSEPK